MYKCLECGNSFEDPRQVETDCGYDTEYTHIPYIFCDELCPFCGAENITDDVISCDNCGEWFSWDEVVYGDSGEKYCDDCANVLGVN